MCRLRGKHYLNRQKGVGIEGGRKGVAYRGGLTIGELYE